MAMSFITNVKKAMIKNTANYWNEQLSDRPAITLSNGMRTTDYQTWKIAFGRAGCNMGKGKRWRSGANTVVTNPIVFRDLQEDRFGTLLYKKLCEVAPQRLFPPEYYFLEYQLPDAPFRIQARLDDISEVKRVYREFEKVPVDELDKMAKMDRLNIVPRDPLAPVYNSEPEDIVQGELRTIPSITQFMTEGYLAGRIDIKNFDHVMRQRPTDMRRDAFLLIPRREQHNHTYLKEEKRKKKLSAEDAYRLDKIDLEEYIDMKFPERVVQREKREKDYPLPEIPHVCIICGKCKAHIKCMECENRACEDCIREHYWPDETRDVYDTQTFLLVHHTYCLKNGVPSKAFFRGVDRSAHKAHGKKKKKKGHSAAKGSASVSP
jgi:hypothetical protein